MTDYLIEAKNLSKKFPGVLANDNVSLTLEKGEILALLGENGAGKSTLVKMIYGLYGSDGGELFIKGKKLNFIPQQKQSHWALAWCTNIFN